MGKKRKRVIEPGFHAPLDSVCLGAMSDEDFELIKDKLSNRLWRLNNLYYIIDKKGNRVKFKMNFAQKMLYRLLHWLNVILKGRQMGFTTFIAIFCLDTMVFGENLRAGFICHRLEDARRLLRDKIMYAYDNLPEQIRIAAPVKTRNTEELLLDNDCSVRVGVSMRSGTVNFLHISEFGKICAEFPKRALEINTGALQAIAEGNFVFVESTAEGAFGAFYELSDKAEKFCELLKASGKALGKMDWMFHFYPWYIDPTNVTDPEFVIVDAETAELLEEWEEKLGITLSGSQRAWYMVKKNGPMGLGESMSREYPFTPADAFSASTKGKWFTKQFKKMYTEGRVWRDKDKRLFDPKLPVHTFWDIGMGDYTTIWFAQEKMGMCMVIDYFEGSDQGSDAYAQELRDKAKNLGYNYGYHFGPHDAVVREWTRGGSNRSEVLFNEEGIVFVPTNRCKNKGDAINKLRLFLDICIFDEVMCYVGLNRLQAYKKKWNAKLGFFMELPEHDEASHTADSAMVMADNGYLWLGDERSDKGELAKAKAKEHLNSKIKAIRRSAPTR